MHVPSAPADRARRRRRKKLAVFALSVVVLPLLVLVAFHSSSSIVVSNSPLFHARTNGQNGNPSGSQNPRSNETISVTNGTLVNVNAFNPNASFDLPNIPESIVVGIIVLLFAIVSFGIFRNLRSSTRLVLGFNPEEDLKEREEVAKVLDDAVSKLEMGGEYQRTVLECYRQITEILEKKSAITGKTLTAREFKEMVSGRLGIDTPYLAEATELFELARYSEREITEDQAKAAIYCLSNLSNIIKRMKTVS